MIEELHDMHASSNDTIRSNCSLEGHENVLTYLYYCIVGTSAWRRFFYQIV